MFFPVEFGFPESIPEREGQGKNALATGTDMCPGAKHLVAPPYKVGRGCAEVNWSRSASPSRARGVFCLKLVQLPSEIDSRNEFFGVDSGTPVPLYDPRLKVG